MSFCEHCGAEESDEWTGKYRKQDGYKEMRSICSRSPCAHSGHDWFYTGKDTRFWGDMIFRCKRCEKEVAPPYGMIWLYE